MFRPMACALLTASVLVFGVVPIRLVAQDAPGAAGDAQEAAGQPQASQWQDLEASGITSKTAIEFASRLVGDDELTAQLKASLQTPPGALVLRDRAGYIQAMARRDASAESIPRFFDELFEATEQGLILRAGRESERDALVTSSRQLDADITMIQALMAEKAKKIELNSDLDKIVHRFMSDDAAPIILYARQLRPRMRPGAEIMERLFEQQLAKQRNGTYAVRPDARPGIEERFKIYDERMKLLEQLKQDLAEFADLITPLDDSHVRFKRALKNPLVATRLALPIFEGERLDRRLYDNIVNQFEGAVREGPEGLLLLDQAMEHLQRVLPDFERVAEVADSIRAPLAAFATRISEEDDFHKAYKQFLETDLALVRAAVQVQYVSPDIKTAVDTYFNNMLSETDDGKLEVDTTNISEEQIIGLVSGVLREARMARRKGREANELIEQVSDPELREAMSSPGGKVAIGDELRKRDVSSESDGLAAWVSEHFHSTPDGYTIRDDRRGEIEAFVRHVDEVAKELENADF